MAAAVLAPPAPSGHAPLRSDPAERGASTAPRSFAQGGRDTGIDMVRALSMVAIVVLHGLQVGVVSSPAGSALAYATVGRAWYPPLTWLLQVLPLFFVIGGFAGLVSYRRLRARGGTPAHFVAGRVRRLLVPATLTVATVGGGLAILAVGGVDGDLLHQIGCRYGETLWFLGVFLAAQALLPAMVALHERAAVPVLVGLVASAVGVDALRLASGIEAVGYLDLAFVWLALQQLGFFLAEGRIDRLGARTRLIGALGALGILGGTVAAGVYSPDLIAAMNPPTSALLLLGVAQTLLLSLLRPRLQTLSEGPLLGGFTRFVTARAMTIYLWNLPILLMMAGATALLATITGVAPPALSSSGWWLTRPLWLAIALALGAVVAAVLGAVESAAMPPPTDSLRRAVRGVLLGIAAVLLLLLLGTSPFTAAAATALMLLAISGAGGGGPGDAKGPASGEWSQSAGRDTRSGALSL